MELWDLLAVTNGVAFVLGGYGGVIAGAQLNASYRSIADDGQRGAFAGAWVGTAVTFTIWLSAKVS